MNTKLKNSTIFTLFLTIILTILSISSFKVDALSGPMTVSTIDDLKNALQDMENGQTIYLNNSINIDSDTTLDLNGKTVKGDFGEPMFKVPNTLSFTIQGSGTIQSDMGKVIESEGFVKINEATIKSGGDVTIGNYTENAILTVHSGTVENTSSGHAIESNGTANIIRGTINGNENNYAIYNNGVFNFIDECTINGVKNYPAIHNSLDGTLNLINGTIKSTESDAIYNNGSLNFTGGTITSGSGKYDIKCGSSTKSTFINFENGVSDTDVSVGLYYDDYDDKVVPITLGDNYGNIKFGILNVSDDSFGPFVIAQKDGGELGDTDLQKFTCDVEDTDLLLEMGKIKAQKLSLEDIIKNKTADKIVLDRNYTVKSTIEITSDTTIDLAGHTISGKVDYLFEVTAGKKFTIMDSSEQSAGSIKGTGMTSTPIKNTGGEVVIESGTISSKYFAIANESGTVTINGGKIESTNNIVISNKATLNIKGGELSSEKYENISNYAGDYEINISGGTFKSIVLSEIGSNSKKYNPINFTNVPSNVIDVGLYLYNTNDKYTTIQDGEDPIVIAQKTSGSFEKADLSKFNLKNPGLILDINDEGKIIARAKTFEDFVAGINPGDKIVLDNNYTINETFNIYSDTIIDLAGFELSGESSNGFSLILISDGKSLTIEDSSSGNTGKIISKGGDTPISNGDFYHKGGTLTIKGGNFIGSENSFGVKLAIYNNGTLNLNYDNATFDGLIRGYYNATSAKDSGIVNVYNENSLKTAVEKLDKTICMNLCDDITCNDEIIIDRNTAFDLDGHTLKAEISVNQGCQLNIIDDTNSGKLVALDNKNYSIKNSGKVFINGVSVDKIATNLDDGIIWGGEDVLGTTEITFIDDNGNAVIFNENTESIKIAFRGSSFTAYDLKKLTCKNFNADLRIFESDSKYIEMYYNESTLEELIEKTPVGGTLTLTKDYMISETLTIDKNITIDLNGNTLTGGDIEKVLDVTGCTLTITDGKNSGGIVGKGTGTVINVNSRATLIVDGGKISTDRGVAVYNGGMTNVNGGTVSSDSGTAISNIDTAYINNGTVSTNSGIAIHNQNTVYVNNGTVSATSGRGLVSEIPNYTIYNGNVDFAIKQGERILIDDNFIGKINVLLLDSDGNEIKFEQDTEIDVGIHYNGVKPLSEDILKNISIKNKNSGLELSERKFTAVYKLSSVINPYQPPLGEASAEASFNEKDNTYTVTAKKIFNSVYSIDGKTWSAKNVFTVPADLDEVTIYVKNFGSLDSTAKKVVIKLGEDEDDDDSAKTENSDKNMIFSSINGGVIFDDDATEYLNSLKKQGNLELVVVEITDDKKAEMLTAEQLAVVGDNQIFSVTLKLNGKIISDFKGNATVTLSEDFSGITGGNLSVYYVAEDGKLTEVPCSVADFLSFITNHFSIYMVADSETVDISTNAPMYDSCELL